MLGPRQCPLLCLHANSQRGVPERSPCTVPSPPQLSTHPLRPASSLHRQWDFLFKGAFPSPMRFGASSAKDLQRNTWLGSLCPPSQGFGLCTTTGCYWKRLFMARKAQPPDLEELSAFLWRDCPSRPREPSCGPDLWTVTQSWLCQDAADSHAWTCPPCLVSAASRGDRRGQLPQTDHPGRVGSRASAQPALWAVNRGCPGNWAPSAVGSHPSVQGCS